MIQSFSLGVTLKNIHPADRIDWFLYDVAVIKQFPTQLFVRCFEMKNKNAVTAEIDMPDDTKFLLGNGTQNYLHVHYTMKEM